MTVEALLERLQGVTRTSNGWDALCPAHGDNRPSLGVAVGTDNRILLKCRAGCSIESIVSALGLSMKDLFSGPPPATAGRPREVAAYDYKDAKGKLRYQNVRYQPKTFKLRRPNTNGGWTWNLKGVKRIPYRLPELLGREHVYITEGEKCQRSSETA
jgi:putative DNA primase/helicase